MVKKIEGSRSTSSDVRTREVLLREIKARFKEIQSSPISIQQYSRERFATDVKEIIGNTNDATIPLDIKPVLQGLREACDVFVVDGDELLFFGLYQHALTLCSKSWGSLSYWFTTEQSQCYAIYWGLQAALDSYHENRKSGFQSKNDGLAKNDSDFLPSPDPKVTKLWRSQQSAVNRDSVVHKIAEYSALLLQHLGKKAKKVHNVMLQQHDSKGLETFEAFAQVKNRI